MKNIFMKLKGFFAYVLLAVRFLWDNLAIWHIKSIFNHDAHFIISEKGRKALSEMSDKTDR